MTVMYTLQKQEDAKAGGGGMFKGLIDTIIGNLQLSIGNVHIRYEVSALFFLVTRAITIQQPVLQTKRYVCQAAGKCLMRRRTSRVALQPSRQADLCSNPLKRPWG